MFSLTRTMALYYAVACVEERDSREYAAELSALRYNLDKNQVLKDLNSHLGE